MMALNYAILKMFTKIEEGCADTVIDALKSQYGTFKAFNKKDIINALMTAEANGLLEESRFDLDSSNEFGLVPHRLARLPRSATQANHPYAGLRRFAAQRRSSSPGNGPTRD